MRENSTLTTVILLTAPVFIALGGEWSSPVLVASRANVYHLAASDNRMPTIDVE